MTEKEILRDIVKREGVSQYRLAREMGVSQPSVNNYLHRGKEAMKVNTFQRILKTLGWRVVVCRVGEPVMGDCYEVNF